MVSPVEDGAGLEFDHVFCMVPPDGDWADRLAAAGWQLDAGTVHEGQGTRNRRLVWAGRYLELVWVYDRAEAAGNALRLDRRADWAITGASPLGVGLRGLLPEEQREHFWRYDGLPIPVWVHRDSEAAPERPLVFVLEVGGRRRPAHGRDTAGRPGGSGVLHQVTLRGPSPARLPPFDGPRVEQAAGPPGLELVATGGRSVEVTDLLRISA
jgi:Glyoxalase-like domain